MLKKNAYTGELDLVQHIPLGGARQKIHILGTTNQNPLLLFLHGGPGLPDRAGVMRRRDLTRDFTVVAWDQRGTGGSYYGAACAALTVDQLVEDARELCDYLCETFQKQRLFLLCGGWGTLLGTLLAYRYPKRVAAYVGSGQWVDGARNEQMNFDFALRAARERGDAQSEARLLEIGPPARGQYRGGLEGLLAQREIMMQYGGYARGDQVDKSKRQSLAAGFARAALKKGEYTAGDLYGILRGYLRSLEALWPGMTGYDLTRECNTFEMPYYIFQGRRDPNTPSALVEEFYASVQAPQKELVWFEHSGHSPISEEGELYKRLLQEKLAPAAR